MDLACKRGLAELWRSDPVGPHLTIQGMAMIIRYGIVMLGVCMLGCVAPIRRALNIEPTIALRTE